MSEITRPPISRRLQARFFRVVNVPMRLILGLPIATPPGRNLMLAFVIGRKSGKMYRQPVSYVRDELVSDVDEVREAASDHGGR